MASGLWQRIERQIYNVRTYSWLLDPRSALPVPELKVDRPIFLIGTQGGGLTLLSRMLRRHPDAIGPAGNSAYWTAADEMQNVYGLALPAELTGLRYKAPPHPVLTAPRSWTFATADLLPLYRKRAEDATPEMRRAFLRAIRLSAVRHARDRRRFRFVDKSQSYSVRVGLLHALLRDSDPRFVLVPREPYASVWRAATGKAGDMRRLEHVLSYEERIRLCAEHYANTMRAAFEDADALGIDMLVLPFERLLSSPEESLRLVCAHVDLEFRPDMLPAAGQTMPIGSRYRDRWYPLRPDVNAPYEKKVDRLTIDQVNHHLGDLLGRLGYERRE
jgi:hypothetical protein